MLARISAPGTMLMTSGAFVTPTIVVSATPLLVLLMTFVLPTALAVTVPSLATDAIVGSRDVHVTAARPPVIGSPFAFLTVGTIFCVSRTLVSDTGFGSRDKVFGSLRMTSVIESRA